MMPKPSTAGAARTRWVGGAALATFVVLLAVLPELVPPFYLFVLTRILILGLFATAFNIVFGFAGMPSLGHAAFFGLGAYVVGIATVRADVPFPMIAVLTVLAGAALGLVFGVLNLRARGIYLLLLTLALAQAVFGLAFQQVDITGGDNGISGITRDGLPVPESLDAFYWLTIVVVAVCLGLMWVFMRSPVGMAITGLRESESRLAATGYRVGAYRVYAFVVSGTFSAVAGMLDAYLLGSVSPSALSFLLSAEVMVFAILGGAAYFFGPLLGAAIILSLELYVSTFTDRWTIVLGVLYVLTALYLREGLLGRLAKVRRKRRADTGSQAPANEAGSRPVPDVDDLVKEPQP